ncbi:MAG: L-histidine N(alpha)-methyltransferase [Planctomycetota bacterium]|nr:L-histidine N(alpha)-methyltransferase [Planctomycetota bacterium]
MRKSGQQAALLSDQITVTDHLPPAGDGALIRSLLEGLATPPRHIPCRFLYDATGSQLFERITALTEYYLTRFEKALLRRQAARLAADLKELDIVELGSGDRSKISILLDAVDPPVIDSLRYVPVDVSREAIEQSATALAEDHPGLTIHGIVADFLTQLHLIPERDRRLFCFFGSTIGNLAAAERSALFETFRRLMRAGDTLLLGLDLVKRRDIFERAYNDSRGITAAFNLNILNAVNTIAGTDFDPSDFEHVAFYNDADRRVEMHLEAQADVRVASPHLSSPITISRGERIHTENSHKFTKRQIIQEAEAAGLIVDPLFTDPRAWFGLARIRPDA